MDRMLARLRLGQQIGLMVLVFLAGLGVSTLVSVSSLRHVMVNGPIFDQIARDTELVADILPPPAYIVDAYATLLQLKLAVEHGADDQIVQRLLAESRKTREEYEQRLSHWKEVLPQGELRRTLTDQAATPAREFFEIRDREVIPALLAGDTAKADELIWKELRPRFEAHRQAIDRTVELAYASVESSQQRADTVVAQVNLLVPAVGISIALLAGAFAYALTRSLTARLGRVSRALDEITTTEIPALESALAAMSRGDLGATVSFNARPMESSGRDEVAVLTAAYNRLVSALASVQQSFSGLSTSLRDMVGGLKEAAEQVTRVGAELHRRVEEITGATHDVTGATERVAQGSATQATELARLRQSLTELADTSDALAKAAAAQARVVQRAFELASELARRNEEAATTARSTGELAGRHAEHAIQGQEAVRRTMASIATAQAESDKARQRVDEMVSHARSIEQVVAIVRSITEHTNLLALNAAIEAARAGEAGRGFTVVAEEVRKLSASAAESTGHIAELVDQLQRAAAAAVQAADESQHAMTAVVSDTTTVSELFASTASAARELAELSEHALALAEQALRSVQHLHAEMEQAASTVEETSAAAAELSTTVTTISASASQLSTIGEQNAQASEHASNAMDQISHEVVQVAQSAEALLQLAERLLRETERFRTDDRVVPSDGSARRQPVRAIAVDEQRYRASALTHAR
jgi:methyl-accepting chemotaxis protein